MSKPEGHKPEHEEAVRAMHDRSTDAVLSHDRKGVEDVFHPAFRSTGGDFQFESRDDIARGVEEGTYQYKRIENRDQNVEFVSDNVAIVTSQRTVEATVKGEPFASTFHNTSVLVNDGNDWKVLVWSVNC